MSQKVDLLKCLDFEVAVLHQLVDIQVSLEPESVENRGKYLLEETDNRVLVSEVIQEHKITTWFTDPFHLTDHLHRVGNHGYEVGRQNAVKATVRELQVCGIHLEELNVAL